MSYIPSLLSFSLLVTITLTSPFSRRDDSNPSLVQGLLGNDGYWNDYDGGTNAYVMYTGDGSRDDKWPGQESWVSFNEMWITNAHVVARSCDLHYKVANNNAQETQDLYDSIKQVAHETRVDHRFIFAAVMLESEGCVRAASDGDNHGILQSYKGAHTCNDGSKVQTPCSKDQILGMIRDGIAGSTAGHGFAEDINEQSSKVGNEVAWAYYRAARLYNSGSIDGSEALEKGGPGQHCYASDMANKLMGWVDAQSTCTLDK